MNATLSMQKKHILLAPHLSTGGMPLSSKENTSLEE